LHLAARARASGEHVLQKLYGIAQGIPLARVTWDGDEGIGAVRGLATPHDARAAFEGRVESERE
jgi:hypothetical protein